MRLPLIIALERGRAIIKEALEHVIDEIGLPAFLVEGILLDLLADVRAQKATEIGVEYEKAIKSIPTPAPASAQEPSEKSEIESAKGEKSNE